MREGETVRKTIDFRQNHLVVEVGTEWLQLYFSISGKLRFLLEGVLPCFGRIIFEMLSIVLVLNLALSISSPASLSYSI